MSYCDWRCVNCIYSAYLSYDNKGKRPERLLICDYIGFTGKKRPCSAGKDCTVRYLYDAHTSVKREIAERQYRNRQRIKGVLNGAQRKFFQSYYESSGENHYTLAAKLGVTPAKIQSWYYEKAYANWNDLAAIGIIKPPDMPSPNK